jgi:hypothetical protein
MSSTFSNPVPDPDELARALAAFEHWGQTAIALSDKASETGMTRAWDLGSVARSAMREAARLGQLEAELTESAPLAAARVRLIGDVAAVCLAAVVTDAVRAMLTDWGDHNPEGDPDPEGER